MDEPTHEEFDAWLRLRQFAAVMQDSSDLRDAVWRRIRQTEHEVAEDPQVLAALFGDRFELRLTASLVAAALAVMALSALIGVAAGSAMRPGPDLLGFETIRRPPELLRPPGRDPS